MDVLIRYRCQVYHQPNVRCPDCNGNGYLERWVPYFLVRYSSVLFKDVPFVIRDAVRRTTIPLLTSTKVFTLYRLRPRFLLFGFLDVPSIPTAA